jgi:hypothetical protein
MSDPKLSKYWLGDAGDFTTGSVSTSLPFVSRMLQEN